MSLSSTSASQAASLKAQLAALHDERVRTWAPEKLQVNIDQRQTLVAQAASKRFIQTGDPVAPFSLSNVDGGELTLDALTANGPAVLIFFRFEGCPACNIALPYYDQQLYPTLQQWGVPLVAVSPQVPERLGAIKTRHGLRFRVATDRDNTLARRFGILYTFDEASQQAAVSQGGLGIGEVTGTGTWELSQPTVVVIGQDQRVYFAEVSPDWLLRTEADPILAAVSELLALTQQAKVG
jgi:peroxiredoxin